jgi:hypothetical protein
MAIMFFKRGEGSGLITQSLFVRDDRVSAQRERGLEANLFSRRTQPLGGLAVSSPNERFSGSCSLKITDQKGGVKRGLLIILHIPPSRPQVLNFVLDPPEPN